MRLVHTVLPVAALLASGFFLYSQNSGLRSARTEADYLRKTFGLAKALPRKPSSLPGGTKPSVNGSPDSALEDPNASDVKFTLKDLAAATRQQRGGVMPDLKTLVKVQSSILEMSTEEISTLLEETAASELSEEEKAAVESMLVQSLAQKDPKAAVMAGADLLDDSGSGDRNRWMLNSAFNQWVVRNPQEAAAWYDEQLAAGKFENKALSEVNEVRVSFESGLISSLLLKDPAAAEARLAALTPEERVATLSRGWDIPVTPEGQDAFVRTARNVVEERDQAGVIANYARMIGDRGKLEDVSAFLAKSGSAGEERQQIIQQAASGQIVKELRESGTSPTLESTAAWRTWVQENSPEGASGIIGQSMGEALNYNEFSFDKAASLLPEMVPAADRDVAVVAFLDKARWRAKGDAAVSLAQSIQDEALRTKAMENLKPQGTSLPTPVPVKTK
ncbi:MAG: hypothetical protein JWM59_4080 [Verrucomicrobiales bacterium]|nr:hypothetical protein [Verrucomicrobiales bacterium]